jgi:hypothetical protein
MIAAVIYIKKTERDLVTNCMPFNKPIDSYTVSIASFEKFNEWKANIYLKSGNTIVVDLRFVKDPTSLLQFQHVVQNGISTIYDTIDQLPIYLDILRNEKPLYVTLYENASGTFAHCLLNTNLEPIGENEKTP